MAIPVLALALSIGLTAAPPPTRFVPDNPPALTAPLLRPVAYGYCDWRCQEWRAWFRICRILLANSELLVRSRRQWPAWFRKCHSQVTPEIDRALMVKGFLILGVTLI